MPNPFVRLFGTPGAYKKYDSPEALFRGLERQESAAVECVALKCLPGVRKTVQTLGLPADLADDVLSESLVIFLTKIESGEYCFQGHAPGTFLLRIARGVSQNYTRSNRGKRAAALEDHYADLVDESADADLGIRERAELVEQLLRELGPPCNDLIRLRYLEGLSDKAVLEQNKARYANVESLKTSRSKCMKTLREMAQQATLPEMTQ